MDEKPDAGTDRGGKPLRRILVGAGLVLVALLLIAIAIYAAAFVMLAPMMQ